MIIYIPGIIYPINKPYLIPYNGQQKWDRPVGHPVMGIRVVAKNHPMPWIQGLTGEPESLKNYTYIFIDLLIYLCINLIYIYYKILDIIYDYDIYYPLYIAYYI